MTLAEGLAWAALALAALPAGLGALNLLALRPPAPPDGPFPPGTLVSILIPARNERENIGPAVDAALLTEGVPFEVVVMDDGSTDGTDGIVRARAARDPRLRLEAAPPLPPDWAGKAHACHNLAGVARGTHLLFADADVRLGANAAAALLAHQERTGAGLVSAVPRQLTLTWGELLTVPMINLLLLGYLPVPLMRRNGRPELGAACGQLLFAERGAYAAVGGHAANPGTRHDGIKLARRFRQAGRRTDLVAGAGLATCRMYAGFAECWQGFLKNAREAMATPTGLPVWTVLLLGGHVLPPALLLLALAGAGGVPLGPALLATLLSFGFRAAVTAHARESRLTVPLHPLTVLVGLAVQWSALLGLQRGRARAWKGRVYGAG